MTTNMQNIFISLSPNVEPEDLHRARSLVVQPRRWLHGDQIAVLEQWLRERFEVQQAWSVASGRIGLAVILEALGVGEGDEVLLQAFTCNAVPNPVLWRCATPVYVDIDAASLTMDVADLERKITPRTKAIIVQHTFGYAADIERIVAIAHAKNIPVIEDCAHAMGVKINGKRLGKFGDAAFFSFGRDKVVSSVFGGAVIAQNAALAERITAVIEQLPMPLRRWVLQQLLHPILMEPIMRHYTHGGKYALWLLQKMHVLSRAVSWQEKQGEQPPHLHARLPNALASLAVHQLTKAETMFAEHRKGIAALYRARLPQLQFAQNDEQRGVPLRVTLRVKHPAALRRAALHVGIQLGDWYDTVIAPKDTNLSAMRYTPGSCPVAEQITREVINLPTHIRLTRDDADRIIAFLLSYDQHS